MEDLVYDMLALILACCAEYAPALRAVCQKWRAVAAALPPRETRGRGVSFLASRGHGALLAWTRMHMQSSRITQFGEAVLEVAAGCGNESLCRQAQAWGATHHEDMMRAAAVGGHASLCALARNWGNAHQKLLLKKAIEDGATLSNVIEVHGVCSLSANYEDDMTAHLVKTPLRRHGRLKASFPTGEIPQYFVLNNEGAALAWRLQGNRYHLPDSREQLDLGEMLLDWGEQRSDVLLAAGAAWGHASICRLAREWGQLSHQAITLSGVAAAGYGHVEIVEILKTWLSDSERRSTERPD